MVAATIFHELVTDSTLRALAVVCVAVPGVALLLYLLLLRLVNAQRTAELFRVLFRWRFVFFLLSLLGENVVERVLDLRKEDLGSVAEFAVTALLVGLRLLAGVLLWLSFMALLRVLHSEFLERHLRAYGRVRARNTAMLLYSLVAPLTFLLSVAFVFSQFHLDVASYLVTLGGLSVALGLAVQRLLTNVFAGLSLALDAPFSRSDLIRVGDNRYYEVVRRGMRVTTVRDISTHETVYLPNNKLAEEPLVEVTRPTDDVRVVIDVGVPHEVDLRSARQTLLDVALGHPHVAGPFKKKAESIPRKATRLLLRGDLDECMQHWIELARLTVEDELNSAISEFRRQLQASATKVDRLEQRGFTSDEKEELTADRQRLRGLGNRIERLTTVWLLSVRNGVARGRVASPGEPSLLEPSPSEEKIVETLHAHGAISRGYETGRLPTAGELNQLKRRGLQDAIDEEVRINRDRMHVLRRGLEERARDFKDRAGALSGADRLRELLLELRIADGLARSVQVHPETPEMRDTYIAPSGGSVLEPVVPTEDWLAVQESYTWLGAQVVAELVHGANAQVEKKAEELEEVKKLEETEKRHEERARDEEFIIRNCRSRAEDLYLSEHMIEEMLDNSWCRMLGEIVDDDERSDLAELFRVWGDKTYELVHIRLADVMRSLQAARATTIDTDLRELAEFVPDNFKDPFPTWKQPIIAVEGFDDSSVHLAMKVYIDNVRMDKYMRMYATLTNLRMRVVERLGNAGIQLPFPRRDVRLIEWEGRHEPPFR